MCSTCNTALYTHIGEPPKDYLQKPLIGSLLIQCQPDGTRFTLRNEANPDGIYHIYFCPTCGRFLWKGK